MREDSALGLWFLKTGEAGTLYLYHAGPAGPPFPNFSDRITSNEAAPPFAVFKGWEPRSRNDKSVLRADEPRLEAVLV